MTAASTDANWDDAQRERQAANLLGALALRLSDGLEGSTANAALSALDQFLDAPRIDLLAQVLGLTSSGTVRLIDRLEHDGLVRRTSGDDGRVTSIQLTASGRRRARAVSQARMELLEATLGSLSPEERRQFGELAGKLLAGLVRPPGATRWTCRLCDLAACGRAEGHCPVYEAAKSRVG